MQLSREQIIKNATEQLEKAYEKHGKEEWKRHEFYGILKEEVDEVWDEIKKDGDAKDLIAEVEQVIAVCIRFLETSSLYNKKEKDSHKHLD
jgi:NTP pyrophosphatase (non-canonical NTP hydrolase)